MSKKEKLTTSQADGVQYKRAKMWQIALSQLTGAGQMCFYMLMTYATYIGNVNYGILVAVTGVIITASRIFDGITDPICAYIIERFNSKHGKIRIFMLLGWLIMALATTAMCNWGAGHLSGAGGLIFFIVCYMVYIIGYTLVGVSTSITGNVMTNDPKQRPTISVFSTIYSYLSPMLLMGIGTGLLLPMFGNQVSGPYLATFNYVAVGASLFFYLLSCIGIAPYDKPENFEGVSLTKSEEEKPGIKDMWALIKDNKELQRYMVAAVSDKLAQTIGSVSVVTVMLYGIMIQNYGISTIITIVAMLPGIVFAIIGARIAGKHGNKKAMVDWTWVSIVINVIYAAFLLFTDTTQITRAIVPSVIFFLLLFGGNAAKMVVSTATNALRMDIVDYELYRTGRFMPASVSATYSFVDKLVSSLGSTIATGMVALIGYNEVAPQAGDPLTAAVKWMTVILLIGFPILGWICTILAMKKSELSKEKMIEVQKAILERSGASEEAVELATDIAYAENLKETVEENYTPGE